MTPKYKMSMVSNYKPYKYKSYKLPKTFYKVLGIDEKKVIDETPIDYDFMKFDHKIYVKAELFEYIKIMFNEGKIDFWDLYFLQEMHDLPLIDSEMDRKAEPSDKVVLQITI